MLLSLPWLQLKVEAVSVHCLQRLQLSFNGIDLYFKYTQPVPVNNSDGLTTVAAEHRTENIPLFLMEKVGLASVWAAHSGWLYIK